MTSMLKTAEPTMVPSPMSPLVMKTPEGGGHGMGGRERGREGRGGSQMCAVTVWLCLDLGKRKKNPAICHLLVTFFY